ncbi:outer membrane protein assembly factor BamB family protein [Rubinisphaera margarita]|uniref:outer membrane protein assembly factor BamB family protein n=1 Tax=Rubinisphaera margarita TaxID=2909586 RepID=UPI001EE8ED82|nr:PQQ-binding-like beta-propeller repeat protein [Rubinisphaera margarita]MCG6154911.1 PQQ-binding-like beta-propeller repeat protein [Rubinisphaera margarita]
MKALASLALVVLLTLSVQAEEWPRFRGPEGRGVVSNVAWSGTFSEQPVAWRTALPGTGVSSPVIAGEKVFVTGADEASSQRVLLCLDLTTGDEIWRKGFPFAAYKKHKNNAFAASTPAIDGNRLFVLWQDPENSVLNAFTLDGESLWEFGLGPYTHGQGGASSPMVFEDVVYVAHDQKQPSFLVAISAETGEELWRLDRKGERACYPTPGLFQAADGSPEIVFSHCFEGVIGVKPKSGEVLWEIAPFGDFSQRAILSPFVTEQGLLITGSGAQGGERNVVVLRRNAGGEQGIEEAYRIERGAPHVPTPVEKEGLLYLWGDLGIVTCVEAATGRKVWQHRVGGNYFASPICVGENVLNVDTDGNLVVLATGREAIERSRVALEEESRATPAFADGRLIVRTKSHVVCLPVVGP